MPRPGLPGVPGGFCRFRSDFWAASIYSGNSGNFPPHFASKTLWSVKRCLMGQRLRTVKGRRFLRRPFLFLDTTLLWPSGDQRGGPKPRRLTFVWIWQSMPPFSIL
jgi:hypothetical protein